MKCSDCNIEMEGKYVLQLGFGGNIKIVKIDTFGVNEACPEVFVCPTCGKVELYVDYRSIKK